MATVIFSLVTARLKVRYTEVHITLGTQPVHISYSGGVSILTIISKKYHLVAAIFTGAPIQRKCHEVVRCWSLNSIRRQMGMFVVQPYPPLEDKVLFVAFRCFIMDVLV